MQTVIPSRRDINRPALVSAIEALNDVSCSGEFVDWSLTKGNHVLPHGVFLACIGKVIANGIKPMTLISHNYPHEYMRSMQEQDGILKTFLMQQWLQSGKPQLFDLLREDADVDLVCLEKFRASGLQNIVAHGMYDITHEHLSFFSFHHLPYPPRAEQEKTLKMIVPAMHAALMRCLPVHLSNASKSEGKPIVLTGREVEVLSWIRQGKTNGEIGSILGISPHTVKHQVKSVMVKLRVNTRGQAVVEGMRRRYI